MSEYRVWWIEDVPNEPDYYPVNDPREAKKLLDKLSRKSTAETNVGGLEEFDGTDWYEWYDDAGNNIDETESYLEED